jgi:hypothetical protein
MILGKKQLVLDTSDLLMDKQDNVVPLDVQHYQPNRKTLSHNGHLNSRTLASNWHFNGCMPKVNPLAPNVTQMFVMYSVMLKTPKVSYC